MPINSFSDALLTKAGGMSFEIWWYVLGLEMKAHDNPVGVLENDQAESWKEYFDCDYTPHDAIEEDFNNAV